MSGVRFDEQAVACHHSRVNIMKNRSPNVLLVSAVATFLAGTAGGAEIERPKTQAVDALGVDLTTGQVTHSMTPVGIGGATGVAYRISVYANEANWGGDPGFMTNYSGKAKPVLVTPTGTNYYVMRVNDDGGSADFNVIVNGTVQQNMINIAQPYTYSPVGDARHSLVVNGNYLEWTKPDGTLVRYVRGANAVAGATGVYVQTTFPNGFTIDVNSSGVTTNTGFQLNAIYEPDYTPMAKTDRSLPAYVPAATTTAGSGWSNLNPKYVKAVNNAYEFWPAGEFTPTYAWPSATIEWPAGTPRTLFIGDSVVRITDAGGGVAELRYRAYDTAYDQNGTAQYQTNWDFSPRLVGIKPPGATQETFTYDYNNLFLFNFTYGAGWNQRMQSAGVTKTANYLGKQSSYSMNQPTMGGSNYLNAANGDGGVQYVHTIPAGVPGNPNLIEYITTDAGRINFEVNAARNFPVSYIKTTGPSEYYQYDARGNLETIQYSGGGLVTSVQAHYPTSCAPPITPKTCNQAEWVRDARGNVTNYTYHAESGQVASVTAPPDADNRRAQTRYEYTQKRALYFKGGGSKEYGSWIWMKTAERFCIDSNYAGGACGASDEVVTTFEYNNDNLLMTGMTVTSPGGPTLRTCYQYDRYGNQIGKTEPNANLTGCN